MDIEKMDVSRLDTEGFVPLLYPEHTARHMRYALKSWQRFCELSAADKARFSTPDRHHDFGYMFRGEDGQATERKEIFHVRAKDYMALWTIAQSVRNSDAMGFIQAVYSQIEAVTPLVSAFADAVEERYGLKGFGDDMLSAKDTWVFRYLRYPAGSTMLAHPHVDRGGLTLHLGETAPGGEYCSHVEKTWQHWPVGDDQTIIFPGMVLQHRSQGRLKALWHQVTPMSSVEDRYAMVLFVDFKHTHRYSDQSGRLAEKPVGFNWDLPWSEFDELFEPTD